jgi:3-phenylpropionate/trans-cinnamate dioxygenase ferredoxin subunit
MTLPGARGGKGRRHPVCRLEDLPPGTRRSIDLDGRAICLLNVDGVVYALRDTCPHQGASLCRGTLGSTMMPSRPREYVVGLEGRVLRCPWHGWEFQIDSGVSLFDPRIRVKVYPVAIEDDEIILLDDHREI